jgi:queuine tRNA-ribosyltransferase
LSDFSFKVNRTRSWTPKVSLAQKDLAAFGSQGGTVTARLGTLRLRGVEIPTPVFMPVGTLGSVKALSSEDVWQLGYRLILGNTYHLNLRPGLDVLEQLGGLHSMMNWKGGILTDSGGFQVMSLSARRKLDDDGVSFASHIDGKAIRLTPENVVAIQSVIGSDIQMVLDECTAHPASEKDVRLSMERSMRWAQRARAAFLEMKERRNRALGVIQTPSEESGWLCGPAQFGIVQGGMHAGFRQESARQLRSMGFEGIAVGGLSVGESKREMRQVLGALDGHLPDERPRYLMGVGAPDDLIDAVLQGMDMFDCVMPTRNARNGSVFVRQAADPSCRLQIRNARFRLDSRPLDENCGCLACQNYSRAYLRHLFIAREILVLRLLTLHNLKFLYDLMADLREALATSDEQLESAVQAVRVRYVGCDNIM